MKKRNPIGVNSLEKCVPYEMFSKQNDTNLTHISIIWFLCVNCLNYDLCEICHQKDIQIKQHAFLKAKIPIKNRKQCPFIPIIYDELNPRISISNETIITENKKKIEFKKLVDDLRTEFERYTDD
eukprot:gene7010-11175_t